MAYPPDPIVADKAPGPPSSATEHPDHHNDLATAINDTVTELGANPSGSQATVQARLDTYLPATFSASEPTALQVGHLWLRPVS